MPKTQPHDFNYAENTHNETTSNTLAIVAIDIVKKYITDTLPTNVQSSSSSSNDPQVYTLSVKDNDEANKKVTQIIEYYLNRPNRLLQPDDITYLRIQTNPDHPLNNALDKVTLVENGIEVQWYLPRREIFAAVIAAIMDTETSAWPMVKNDEAEQEKIARLDNLDKANQLLRKESKGTIHGICSTGVRHTWLQTLNGYAGKELSFDDVSIILKTIRAVVLSVLNKKSKVDFSSNKDPSEQQLSLLIPLWKDVFLPWLINGNMPEKVLSLINIEQLQKEITEAYQRIGITCNTKLTEQINGYTEFNALKELPCDVMPFLATLNDWIERYHVIGKSSNQESKLIQEIMHWLQNDFFSNNPADDIQAFYRLERLFKALDLLKQNTLLDMADINGIDNKNNYFAACNYLNTYRNDGNRSLTHFLVDEKDLSEEYLREFEKGYQVVRQSLYKDFISNIFSSWFAGDIRSHAQLFKIMAELYFGDLAAIEQGDKKRIILLSDEVLTDWLSQHKDGILDLDMYQINRILLHALNFPATTRWTPLFYETLTQVIEFIEASFNGGEQNQRLHKLRRDAYPERLMNQIKQLSNQAILPGNELTPEIISRFPILTASIAKKNMRIVFFYLALSKAPLSLIKKIIPADDNSIMDIRYGQAGSTLFSWACNYDYMPLITYLLCDMKANVNAKDNFQRTELHYAIQNNRLQLVELLLNHGADVNLKTTDGNSPLHLAIISNHLPIIKCLLAHGADINLTNDDNLNALHQALEYDRQEIIDILRAHGADVHLKTTDGRSALHLAVTGPNQRNIDGHYQDLLSFRIKYNHLSLIENLLKLGAEINAQDNDGNTALHIVLIELVTIQTDMGLYFYSHDEKIRYLEFIKTREELINLMVFSGANLCLPNKLGCNMLHITAALRAPNNLFKMFLKKAKKTDANIINQVNNDGETVLNIAYKSKLIEAPFFNYLIREKADYSIQNKNGDTMLDIMLKSSAKQTFLKNILNESNINTANQSGKTVLHFASQYSYTNSYVNWLLQLGADINQRDSEGNTPLCIAISHQNEWMSHKLIMEGADIFLANADGLQPLDIAKKNGNKKIIKFLNDKINSSSSSQVTSASVSSVMGGFFQPKHTPPHRFVIKGQIDKMNAWLASNPDIDVIDSDGNTALLLAVKHGRIEMASLLLEKGADSHLKNNHKQAPLDIAIETDNKDMMVLLQSQPPAAKKIRHGY